MDLNNPASQNFNSTGKVNPNVLDCGSGHHWDYYLKKCVDDCPAGYHNDSITAADVGGGIVGIMGGPVGIITGAVGTSIATAATLDWSQNN